MILDSIAISNFGPYADRQEISLSPPCSNKPVILFGGLNGGGKTTFLDALQLCLYGPRAKLSSRGKLGYLEYLSRSIHSHGGRRSASIQLKFRHTAEGKEDYYVLRRSWFCANNRPMEELNVLRNDKLEPALSDNWADHVDDLMPANIAHLFLFDGELIERYASPSESASLVETAINSLLGLDVVDQLQRDLQVFERRKKTERLDSDSRTKVAAAEADLQTLRTRLDRAQYDLEMLRSDRIERRRLDVNAADEEFRRIGGDLFQKRQEIADKLASAELSFEEVSDNLRGLASGVLPLLQVTDLLNSAADRDCEDQEIEQSRLLLELLGNRDREMLIYLEARSVERSCRSLLRDYLKQDRDARAHRASLTTSLDLPHETRTALTALLHGQIHDLRRVTDDLLTRYSRAESDLESARSVYHSIPAQDEVADVIRRREDLQSELLRLEAEEARMTGEIERLQRDVERAERSLSVLMETDIRNREKRSDRDRMLGCAVRVRETLATYRVAKTERHVARIEYLVLESYQQLLRKTSLVTRLLIDPKTFSLTLYGRDGKAVAADSLSAGERQLLGIALLWGLAKASGRPLPTAIDTPLGRLDTDHRRHFVDHYVPFASHQTLLFSTNEEIVGDYLERLAPWIGRSYYLDHDDKLGCTRIKPGYFNGELCDHAD